MLGCVCDMLESEFSCGVAQSSAYPPEWVMIARQERSQYSVIKTQQTQQEEMFYQSWSSVVDGEPTLSQNLFNEEILVAHTFLWNSIALTTIIVTELANIMKYGGGGLI